MQILKFNPVIFSLFGVPVSVHVSTMIFLGILLLTGSWMVASMLVLTLLSIIPHEFGHILAAKYYGIKCRGVVILPIGGIAMLEEMPREWKKELWIALWGPLVSFLLALWSLPIAYLLHQWTPVPLWFCLINIALVVFNALPCGGVMDGGRVLRALMSSPATGWTYKEATFRCTRFGQVLAGFVALMFMLTNNFLGAFTLAIVAMMGERELQAIEESDGSGPKRTGEQG